MSLAKTILAMGVGKVDRPDSEAVRPVDFSDTLARKWGQAQDFIFLLIRL